MLILFPAVFQTRPVWHPELSTVGITPWMQTRLQSLFATMYSDTFPSRSVSIHLILHLSFKLYNAFFHLLWFMFFFSDFLQLHLSFLNSSTL